MGVGDVRNRPAPETKKVDVDEISDLIEMSSTPLEPEDKATRKMDADQFRSLLRTEHGADAVAVVEQSIPAYTESKPLKKPALIVADHRLDTRHAGAIVPITKPPVKVSTPRVPTPVEPWVALAMLPAHRARRGLVLRMFVLVTVAIAVAIAVVLVR